MCNIYDSFCFSSKNATVIASKLIDPPAEKGTADFITLSDSGDDTNGISNGVDAAGNKLSPTKLKMASKLRKDKVYTVKTLDGGQIIPDLPVVLLQ